MVAHHCLAALLLSVLLLIAGALKEVDYEIFVLHERLIQLKGTTSPPNFYQLLDLTPDASEDDILKAYKRRTKILHPDRNPNSPSALEEFQILSSAVNVLKNDRARYDYHLRKGIPRYQNGDFYYQSWRPGIATVIVITLVVISVVQYISAWVIYLRRSETENEAETMAQMPPNRLVKELRRRGHDVTMKDLKKELRRDPRSGRGVKLMLSEQLGTKTTDLGRGKPKLTDVLILRLPLLAVNAVMRVAGLKRKPELEKRGIGEGGVQEDRKVE